MRVCPGEAQRPEHTPKNTLVRIVPGPVHFAIIFLPDSALHDMCLTHVTVPVLFPLVASNLCFPPRLDVNKQLALREHIDNEFLGRRRELDLSGCASASSLEEYDASLIVPMWGYRDVKVGGKKTVVCRSNLLKGLFICRKETRTCVFPPLFFFFASGLVREGLMTSWRGFLRMRSSNSVVCMDDCTLSVVP